MMPPQKKARSKLVDRTRSLPTDEVALEKQLGILRIIVDASASGTKWLTTEEIEAPAATLDCDRDRVTRCLPFFEDVGLVERQSPRGALKPTQLAIQVAGSDELGKKSLREKVRETWFGVAITQALKAAKQADEERLLKVISRAGKLDFTKKKRTKNKAKKLIEYLVFSDYLAVDGAGNYSLK